jgi:flagellar basal body rod protein FlgF
MFLSPNRAQGMESLINQAFSHVNVIEQHVLEGHYDLVGEDGKIIGPHAWEVTIKPNSTIRMQMWPLPELIGTGYPWLKQSYG